MLEEKIEQLTKQLGYVFNDPNLLRAALTHRSRGGVHNERLEFLGDAILSFSIAAELYKRFPKAREGDLTRMRALLVRGETLAEIARELLIGDNLNLGLGERKTGGHRRGSILADALEAIIGAIYLDAGVEACRNCILNWYDKRLDALTLTTPQKDAKTRLQEYLQAHRLPLPEYGILTIEGDPHDPIFKVECRINKLPAPVEGVANNRRRAEQAAAEAALMALQALSNGTK